MENITVRANMIKKATNDFDMNMILVGNNVIMINNNMLNDIIVKETVSNSMYESINDSQVEWIRDKETGIEYNTMIGMRLLKQIFFIAEEHMTNAKKCDRCGKLYERKVTDIS